MNDYFTFFYVKHFELPMCMKCAIQINLPCLALPLSLFFHYFPMESLSTEIKNEGNRRKVENSKVGDV